MNAINFYDQSFFRKFENLQGFPLKVSMFPRYPTALTTKQIPSVFLNSYFMNIINDSRGYGGVDGITLGNMARAMNFSTVVIKPIGIDFGYKLSNGTFTGKKNFK